MAQSTTKTRRSRERRRLRQLGFTAIDRLLASMDWDAQEWLTDEECPEYLKLFRRIEGECYVCGESAKRCKCDY